ncbi:hypothetical protein GB937_006113 [Aspergillus fischeri]|nr:hypothetical protein GB937_006113 [Aspergillus fischeri]
MIAFLLNRKVYRAGVATATATPGVEIPETCKPRSRRHKQGNVHIHGVRQPQDLQLQTKPQLCGFLEQTQLGVQMDREPVHLLWKDTETSSLALSGSQGNG